MTARKSTASNEQQASLFSEKSPGRRTKAMPAVGAVSPKPVARPAGKKIWLSATGLETMRRCPRCFWLQYNMKIYQPEGIVSRLANRFDGVIKRYFDLYRGTDDLPPLVAGQMEGRLESPFQEIYFANVNSKYGFKGKLDECLVRPDGKYTPVDHKTSSSDPNGRELLPAYQFQLDAYTFLLEQNRKPVSGLGHLVYFYPIEGERLHQGFPMQITVKTLKTDTSRVRPRIAQAVELLDGPLPVPATECPFCQYIETVKRF